jgi:hypothetical protein
MGFNTDNASALAEQQKQETQDCEVVPDHDPTIFDITDQDLYEYRHLFDPWKEYNRDRSSERQFIYAIGLEMGVPQMDLYKISTKVEPIREFVMFMRKSASGEFIKLSTWIKLLKAKTTFTEPVNILQRVGTTKLNGKTL